MTSRAAVLRLPWAAVLIATGKGAGAAESRYDITEQAHCGSAYREGGSLWRVP
jgi:hypothetical protein